MGLKLRVGLVLAKDGRTNYGYTKFVKNTRFSAFKSAQNGIGISTYRDRGDKPLKICINAI